MEVKETEIRSAIEELSVLVKLNNKNPSPAVAAAAAAIHQQEVAVSSIPTKPFLSLCYCILQVLGNFFLPLLTLSSLGSQIYSDPILP